MQWQLYCSTNGMVIMTVIDGNSSYGGGGINVSRCNSDDVYINVTMQ